MGLIKAWIPDYRVDGSNGKRKQGVPQPTIFREVFDASRNGDSGESGKNEKDEEEELVKHVEGIQELVDEVTRLSEQVEQLKKKLADEKVKRGCDAYNVSKACRPLKERIAILESQNQKLLAYGQKMMNKIERLEGR